MSFFSKLLKKSNDTLDISENTKKGIKKILLTPSQDVIFDGVPIEPKSVLTIDLPELNGKLPNKISLTSSSEEWVCGVRVLELGGEGDKNYFNIEKENDNGVPT